MNYVIGPDGAPITREDLPKAGARWTIRRKAIVFAAIRGGLLTMEEAATLYRFTPAEIASIQTKVDKFGEPGLRQTYLQRYRA